MTKRTPTKVGLRRRPPARARLPRVPLRTPPSVARPGRKVPGRTRRKAPTPSDKDAYLVVACLAESLTEPVIRLLLPVRPSGALPP